MCLLDDMRLIECEVLAPPTASTFERSITKLASYELSNSWNKFCNSSMEYDRNHRWKKTVEKLPISSGETRFKSKVKSPNPSQWNIAVLSIADLVQLAI